MSPRRVSLLALGLLAMACAPGTAASRRARMPPPAPVSRAGTRDPGAGPAPGLAARAPVQGRLPPRDQIVRRAIETASSLVGQRDVASGVRWGDGCVALVRAAFDGAGAPLPPAQDARALHRIAVERGAARRGRPAPGDLVFLADRPGGPVEHVGLVESVSPEGTALVLHRTEHGVLRLRVNGSSPWKTKGPTGRLLNDILVVGAGRVTAGRLLVAYAALP